MTEVFTAKTVDEAKAMAVKKFGKSINEIKFKVIEEGKKGFLGIGQVDAKVEATYIAPLRKAQPKSVVKAEPKPEIKAEPKPEVKEETKPEVKEEPKPEIKEETKPEVKEETKPEIKEETKPEVKEETKPEVKEETKPEVKEETKSEVKEEPKPEVKEEPKPEIKEETKPEVKEEMKPEVKEETKPEVKAKPKSEIRKNARKSVSEELSDEENDDFTLDDFTLIDDESLFHEKVKIAIDYMTSVLRAMDIEADFIVHQNETGAVINIESNNNGTIIGRRGDTLDSLQYLCSIIANKGDKDYFRITIDCLGYRSKRKDTLHQLAVKVAKSVLKSGRSQQLEPMNPYERRVIHSAISEIDGVSSRSVGEEPYRKIIISSNNPKNSKHKGQRRDDRKGGNRRNDRNKRREPIEVKAVDLSTSFEKDYKKPKPEDSMEVGLYGKIEF